MVFDTHSSHQEYNSSKFQTSWKTAGIIHI